MVLFLFIMPIMDDGILELALKNDQLHHTVTSSDC